MDTNDLPSPSSGESSLDNSADKVDIPVSSEENTAIFGDSAKNAVPAGSPDQGSPDQGSEASEQAQQSSSFSSRKPPEEKKKKKTPTGKIATLATICVLVLGLSIWGLTSALNTNDLASVASEQQGSGTSSTNSGSGEADSGTAADEADDAAASSDGETSADGGTDETTGTQGTGTTGGGAADQGQGSTSNGAQSNTQTSQAITVSLSVRCDEAVNAGNATAIAVSNNGAMRSASLRLNAGSTVYDALVASGAAIGSTSSTLGVFITSIDGLAQFEAGNQSGWKYYVNGSEPSYSCDRYVLSDGDVIEWRYVLSA